jgi:hypothetical protein
LHEGFLHVASFSASDSGGPITTLHRGNPELCGRSDMPRPRPPLAVGSSP